MARTRKYGKKRYAPRRTTKRYSRMSSSYKNQDITSLKCEAYTGLQILTGQGEADFVATNNSYWNVSSMLGSSTSFIDMSTRYARYKITGMTMNFYSQHPVVSASLNAVPTIAFAFFPQSLSAPLGSAPQFNDRKLYATCVSTTPQTKYLSFPEGFSNSSQGGYGIWNNINEYTTLPGQISLSDPSVFTGAVATTRIAVFKVVLYITFAGKNN